MAKNRTNPNRFKMNRRKEEAAQLLAEDDFSIDEIAVKIGVSRTTIFEWKTHQEFADRIEEIKGKLGDISMRRVIARRNRRLLSLEGRWRRMQQVIDERSESVEMQNVPGGRSGLLCHNVKGVGKGDNFQLIDLYEVDTGLLKEMREAERQAAQELGQWIEKQEYVEEVRQRVKEVVVDATSGDRDGSAPAPGAGGILSQ